MKVKEIKTYQIVSLGDGENLELEQLRDINSNDKVLVIQIYGHAGAAGIQGHNQGQVYNWNQILELVSSTKTVYPIRLDLCGVCNSHFIQRHVIANTRIDGIWVTNRDTIWQSVYNVSGEEYTFEAFLERLDEDDESASFKGFYLKVK